MPECAEIVARQLERWGMDAPADKIHLMEEYLTLVLERNKQMNLTGFKTVRAAAVSLLCGSLAVFLACDTAGRDVLDLGTGAGFPGVPVKIYRPETRLTLLDAAAKKVSFVREAAGKIGLDVRLINARAEELLRGEERKCHEGKFDIVLSRAAAPLPVLLELAMGFIPVGGVLLAMKSDNPAAEREISASGNALRVMGGEVSRAVRYTVDGDTSPRAILVIEKVRPHAQGYPRAYGRISAKPL